MTTARTTIVIGGSSGIGLAIAERCARDGDRVVLLSRSADKLARAAVRVTDAGASAVEYRCADLADRDGLQQALDGVASTVSGPVRLVLCGGGPPFGVFTDLSLAQWQSAIDAVLLGHVHVLQFMVPRLTRGSAVVIVLSDAVRNAAPDKVLPCALRLALLGTIKCLALQFAGDGIRFNAISPGPTATERAVSLLARAAQARGTTEDEERTRFAASLPMGRLAAPAEIAAVAHFLLSDDAAYVSGMNYMCDGCLTGAPL